jgi:L-ribulose-5-phosphate 4-epimerase
LSAHGAVAAAIGRLRREVAELHRELTRYGLVVWTAGNISARVPGADLMVIKPSGVPYDDLTPEAMVVADFDGQLVEGDFAPSSDTAAHAYVYRHRPDVGGQVHTHSPYATAWAARREPIPCLLTMMGDEFGGEIPVGPFALIGDDSIGRGIVETLARSRSKAVLMANHGVFTVGRDARAAVKAAVMCEEVARTVHLARSLGAPAPIPADLVDRLYDRYQHVYGQTGRAGEPAETARAAEPAETGQVAGPGQTGQVAGPAETGQVAGPGQTSRPAEAGETGRAGRASPPVPTSQPNQPPEKASAP